MTVRLPGALLGHRGPAATAASGLAFDEPGGPVLAVCGLAGGAGTTTLAWLLARHAARESAAAVLICEPEALAAGLADRAGAASTTALGELARLADAGERPTTGAFADLGDGLRLIGAAPRQAHPAPAAALARVLSDARAAHGLVVCDCRTLDHPASATLIAGATHVLWTLPATPTATRQARAMVDARSLPSPGRAREALVAIATQPAARASVGDLRALAGARHERLILFPHTPELARGADSDRRGRLAGALTQLATFLRRPR